MSKESEAYEKTRRLLHGLRQKEKAALLLRGCILWAVLIIAFLFGVILLEAAVRFSSAARYGLLGVLLLHGIISFLWFVVRPLYSFLFKKQSPDDVKVALKIGATFPAVSDRLADALQVFHNRHKADMGTSPSLAEASLERMHRQVESLDLNRVVSKRGNVRLLRFGWVVLLLCAISTLFLHKPLGQALGRLTHPARSYPGSVPFRLVVEPGDVQVLEGTDVVIRVTVEGEVPEHLILHYGEEDAEAHEEVLTSPYEIRFSSLREDVLYRIERGVVRSPTYRITVLHRPLVRSLKLSLTPPQYAGKETRPLDPDVGDVRALKGTTVSVEMQASKTLSSASLIFDKRGRQQMRALARETKGRFVVQEDDEYHIELTDSLGIQNANPIVYSVRVRPDLEPVARILFPADNVDLDESMTLPLTLEAEDDFGLSAWRLGYSVQRGGVVDTTEAAIFFLALALKDEPSRITRDFTWDLSSLDLMPENVVSYFLEVWDNDSVSGPKRSRSRTFTARFPSIYEIFQEVEEQQENQVEALEEMVDESRDMVEQLDRVTEEMKVGHESGWEEQRTLQGMAERQQEMLDEVDSLKKRLEEIAHRMDRNDLISLKTLEKYQELQSLYEEIASPELQEAMKKLQEIMEELDPAALKQAAERFQLSQESFLRSVERTLSLLKRIQVEQKVEEIIRRIDDLVRRQASINQRLTKADENAMRRLAEEEQGMAKDAEALRDALDDIRMKMEALPGMPLTEVSDLTEELERQDFSGQIGNVSQSLRQGRKAEAEREGGRLKASMEDVSEKMRTIQQQLQKNQTERVARSLKNASYRLLQLSQGQERLMESTAEGRIERSEASIQQLSLLSGLDQVVDSLMQLSQETFQVTPEMGKALGQARAHMVRSLQLMEQSGGENALVSQGDAIGGLNRSVVAILDALNRMQQGGSGLGMENFLMQLEQMASQQMVINRQTRDLFQQGRMTLEQQASMARLTAEQQALKEAMEDLVRDFGRRSEIVGRLDRLAEEMEEVVRELRQQGEREETIQRQERILSRLLDAQRSVRNRDYSRKRRSETGIDMVRKSPDSLPLGLPEWQERIRQDVLRLAKEGYTAEYQDLIRKYFEALIREQEKDR